MSSAIVADLREVILHRFKTASLRELLDISSSSALKPAPLIRERFEVLDDELVTDHETGLTWLRDYVPGGKRNHADSIEAASKFTLRGRTFRAPTIREQLSIVDYERHNPAFNTDVFKGGSDWVWTSTVDHESPEGCAWGVCFGYGDSFRYGRNYHGFVRAVCLGQF